MNKYIVVQWLPEKAFGYGWAMRVVRSTHPRFSDGSRFDFGFLGIASTEGYVITVLPLPEGMKKEFKEANVTKQKRARKS